MCSKCVINLSSVVSFTKKCHDADKILRSRSEIKNEVRDEDLSVINCDYTENHILNDHSYENQHKNENSHEFEMRNQAVKSEIGVVEMQISDVGLDDMLHEKVETDDCNGLEQEIITEFITEPTYEVVHKGDNVFEIVLKDKSTCCSAAKTGNNFKIPNRVERNSKYHIIPILFLWKQSVTIQPIHSVSRDVIFCTPL